MTHRFHTVCSGEEAPDGVSLYDDHSACFPVFALRSMKAERGASRYVAEPSTPVGEPLATPQTHHFHTGDPSEDHAAHDWWCEECSQAAGETVWPCRLSEAGQAGGDGP